MGVAGHARPDALRKFLDRYGDVMEFCQIQLNYLDWTLQDGKEKYDLLTERDIPIIVMEPLRGGRLCRLTEAQEASLRTLRPEEGQPGWAFRFLMDLPNVRVILSGMSDIRQMRENTAIFAEEKKLTEGATEALRSLAEGTKNSIPCTACRYCCDGCPMGLNIPMLLHTFNDIRFGIEGGLTAAMQLQALPEEKLPTACIGCGACAQVCPQKIDIPGAMQELSAVMDKLPNWEKICRERAEAAKKLEGE